MTTRSSKNAKPKAGKTTRETASGSLAADLQKRLDRRTRELAKTRMLLKEALQQQRATSEVLQVINSSPVELAPVFDAMLKRAMHLCEAAFGGLWVFEGDHYVAKALCGIPAAYAGYLRHANIVPGPHTAPYRFLQGSGPQFKMLTSLPRSHTSPGIRNGERWSISGARERRCRCHLSEATRYSA